MPRATAHRSGPTAFHARNFSTSAERLVVCVPYKARNTQYATRFSRRDGASSFNQGLLRVVPVLAMRAAKLLTLAQSSLQLDMQQLIDVRNDPASCADGPHICTAARSEYVQSCSSCSVCRNEYLYPFVARHSW